MHRPFGEKVGLDLRWEGLLSLRRVNIYEAKDYGAFGVCLEGFLGTGDEVC